MQLFAKGNLIGIRLVWSKRHLLTPNGNEDSREKKYVQGGVSKIVFQKMGHKGQEKRVEKGKLQENTCKGKIMRQ